MIRSAVLVSGKGTKLQSLLDSVFFGEIPELQLVAVISSDANAYALKRARNAGIETVVVEPAMFPNDTSYDMAVKLLQGSSQSGTSSLVACVLDLGDLDTLLGRLNVRHFLSTSLQ